MQYKPEDVVGYECKHISYSTDRDKLNDFVLIKEVVHTKDGKTYPRLRQLENFQRPFYITQKPHQNHKEKKEYEHRSKLQEFKSTDVLLAQNIQRALGNRFPDPNRRLQDVCSNPFVYWADLKVGTYIKEKYQSKWKNLNSFNKIAIFDIETNEYEGTKEPLVVGVVCDNEIHMALPKWYYDRIPNGKERITEMHHRLLSKVMLPDKDTKELVPTDIIKDYEIHYHIFDTIGWGIVSVFDRIHEMLPDFLVAWNMDFDITKILEQLERENIPPERVFCHPDVPEQYRNVWYKQDQASKKTESKTMTKSPADQWHVLYCQASFYVIDAMGLFKKIRTAAGNRPSYSLGNILASDVGVGKLDIPGLPYADNLQWHIDAQRDYPAEYCVYNTMDNLLIGLLDSKTHDLASAVSILSGISMFDIFPSLPKRICDAFTYFLKERDLYIGSVGREIKNDMDESVIGTTGWIQGYTDIIASFYYSDAIVYNTEEVF